MSYLIGMDVGTTGVKVLLVDEAGHIEASAVEEYPMFMPHPLWAEQDPSDWWLASVRALRSLLAGSHVDPHSIVGLGLTGQMHGMVMLDDQGQVLRRCIMWNDQRTAAQCDWIMRSVGRERFLDLTFNPALPGFTAPKIVWTREHEPEIYARAAHILLPKDYIRLQLTGVYATEVSDASGTVLLDVGRRAWSLPVLDDLDIPAAWMPQCYESPDVTGWITPAAAEQTGLPVGLPVMGGAGDQAASAVGTGVVEPGIVSVTMGTSGVVSGYADAPRRDPQGRLHVFCHAVPAKWHVMGVTLSAGGSLRWYRDALGAAEKDVARLSGVDPYDILTAQAANAPPGSEGLYFLPYLTGERTPYADPHARGAFVGLTLRHDRRHMVRAVLEGVAYSLHDCLNLFYDLQIPVREVRVVGGGARSHAWRQILADVFDVEIVTVNVTDSTAFGAALIAGVGAGVYRSVSEACGATIRVVDRVSPEAARAATYANAYPVYHGMYAALKSTFDAIADQQEEA